MYDHDLHSSSIIVCYVNVSFSYSYTYTSNFTFRQFFFHLYLYYFSLLSFRLRQWHMAAPSIRKTQPRGMMVMI